MTKVTKLRNQEVGAYAQEHQIKQNPGDKCEETFATNSKVKVHFQSKHKDDKWNYNDYPYQANESSDLMKHLRATTHQPSPTISDKAKVFSDHKQCYTYDLDVDGYWNLMNNIKEKHTSNRKYKKIPRWKMQMGKEMLVCT